MPATVASRHAGRSGLTALTHEVAERHIAVARVTVTVSLLVIICPSPVSLLVMKEEIRRPWSGEEREERKQRCAEWCVFPHPFHCWVLVIPEQLRSLPGAIPGGLNSSHIPYIPGFLSEKHRKDSSGHSGLLPER